MVLPHSKTATICTKEKAEVSAYISAYYSIFYVQGVNQLPKTSKDASANSASAEVNVS